MSAFLTAPGVEWFRQRIPVTVPCDIVVRWLPQDLLCGASDTDSWRLASSYGWRFRAQRKLHAKVYLVDGTAAFVGSANATRKGLALDQAANIEIGVEVVPSLTDIMTIESLVEASEAVSPELVERIDEVTSRPTPEPGSCSWVDWPTAVWPPPDCAPITKSLCVSECFATDGRWLESGPAARLDSAIVHDLSLLGVRFIGDEGTECSYEKGQMLTAFRQAKVYGWLVQALQREPQRAASFGRLTALLHDALVDDPRPYRSSVKFLLSNLLAWSSILQDPRIAFQRPRHTTVVTLGAVEA